MQDDIDSPIYQKATLYHISNASWHRLYGHNKDHLQAQLWQYN